MGRDGEDGKAVVKHKEGKKEGNRRDRRKAAAVDNTFRRTWDKDEFEEKAADREKAGGRTLSQTATVLPGSAWTGPVECCEDLP